MNPLRMSALRRALILALVLTSGAVLSTRMEPNTALADVWGPIRLETRIPVQINDWELDPASLQTVVNPQQEALLNQLYSETLSRTYVDAQGQRVMLSIAYGKDQRSGQALHFPDVCYPAQGFSIRSTQDVDLQVKGRAVPVRRLLTTLGPDRPEAVTYWVVIGEKVVRGGMKRKLTLVQYGLQGQIPDGLIFRVSSVGADASAQYELQARFVESLLNTLPDADLGRFVGALPS